MPLPKFNEKLYDRVVAHILEEPKRLDMESFAYSVWGIKELGDKAPSCNTVGCFAGWAVALKKKWRGGQLAIHYGAIPNLAQEFLGLTPDERFILFHPTRWPDEDREALYGHKVGSKAYAKVVAEFAKEFKANIKANRKANKE